MIPSRRVSACRYCGSKRQARFLSLGEQPPSNSFLRPDQLAQEARYPLDVYWCEDCSLVQLLDVVPADLIFNDYLYLASSSKPLKEHYAKLAQGVAKERKLVAGDIVVDIGCNDGILLKGYPTELRRIGVEPSKVAELAREAGFEVFQAFFSPECAKSIVAAHGKAKIITTTNVYAHVDDIATFTDGVAALLADDGAFIIEAPYLIDLIDSLLFDTIYHEHLCYLSLTPMVPFLARHGLEVFDVLRVNFGASGPAIRVFVQKRGGPETVRPSVKQMLDDEERWGIRRPETYQAYARRVEGVKDSLLKLLGELRAGGARLAGYGAPAKGNTLLNYAGLTAEHLDCIADSNALKQGLLTPGSHIPVVSDEEFLRRNPTHALLLTWNYLDFFLKNSEFIRRGGRFVVPLPEPRLSPN